jgi:hypothetical protein
MTRRAGGRAWRTDRAHFLATTTETHCWLTDWCGGAYVDRTLPGTHRWGPTADHEIPLLLGGPELVRDGAVLHLAHNWCNAARSNRLRAQLAAAGRIPRPRTPARRPARRTSRNW